uniref:VWFA domain-containing protein n=1 Tax=Petromyzon marinus TaxID=7757 RepID=S4RW58_PETMA
DFYSHSNWIEMGNTKPKDNIFSNDFSEKEVAGPDVRTCTNCGTNCVNNIRPEINSKSLLTSGYYSSQKIGTITVPKPKGKCKLHGTVHFQQSRDLPSRSNIHKSMPFPQLPVHHLLRLQLASLNTEATIKFFRDLRSQLENDLAFGRYLGFEQTTSIGFVIDTTGSMGPFISNVRTEVLRIIDERAQNGELPAMFMLVPFNDPGYGPVLVSKNVTEFRKWISALFPYDGGDEPEMFFSGLMLCLNAIEPHSEIFIFTDASAKDAYLVPQAVAIGVRKKCKVNVVHVRWPRYMRSLDNQGNFQRTRTLTYPEYDEIAFSTGGLMLNPTSTEFQELMVVIGDLTKTQQVNLLNVRHVDTTTSKVLTFPVDNSVSDIVIFYTGTVSASPIITISDPSGTMNSAVAGNTTLLSTQVSGSTFIIRLKEPKICGVWKIQITSPGTSSLRIIGQSSLNFIYKFGVEDDVGPHPGIRVIT